MGKHRGLPRVTDPIIDFNFYYLKDVLAAHINNETPSQQEDDLVFWKDVIGNDSTFRLSETDSVRNTTSTVKTTPSKIDTNEV